MKKFIAIASIIMAVLLSGCKKEEEKSLSGTKWETESGDVTLSFTSVKASLSYTKEGTTYYYSYEYNDPTVTMTPEVSDRPVLAGTVSGTQMTLVNTATEETVGFFNKQ